MAGRLRSISRNQPFISACRGVLVFSLLLLFLRAHLWQWAIAYVACVAILYSRPIFNFSLLLPLLFVIISLPFAVYPQSLFFQVAFAAVISAAFAIVVSVKNLTLTHRDFWVQSTAYCLAYCSLLSFFVSVATGSFLVSWLFTLLLVLCSLIVALRDARLAFPAACVMGELIWVASWLPIGPLSSANLSFLTLLFMGDTLHEGRLSFRRAFLFVSLLGVIALSSYWRL